MFGGIFFLMLVFMAISWFVGSKLKKKFKEFSAIPTSSGLSGAEVAQKMLSDHGILMLKL